MYPTKLRILLRLTVVTVIITQNCRNQHAIMLACQCPKSIKLHVREAPCGLARPQSCPTFASSGSSNTIRMMRCWRSSRNFIILRMYLITAMYQEYCILATMREIVTVSRVNWSDVVMLCTRLHACMGSLMLPNPHLQTWLWKNAWMLFLMLPHPEGHCERSVDSSWAIQ